MISLNPALMIFDNAHKWNRCLHELLSSYVHPLESLRSRGHDIMLPACTSYLHEQSFLFRSLFEFIRFSYKRICVIIILFCFLFSSSSLCVCHILINKYCVTVTLLGTNLTSNLRGLDCCPRRYKCPRKFGVVRLQGPRKSGFASSHTHAVLQIPWPEISSSSWATGLRPGQNTVQWCSD